MLFRLISQKIKKLWRRIKARLWTVPCVDGENVKRISEEAPRPQRAEIDCRNFMTAAEFLLKKAGASGYDLGIGIIASDISALDGINTLMNYVCTRFKYVTLYTDNAHRADMLADLIFSKYGLPILVMGTEEGRRCRYKIVADFDEGKVRCGRDMCISGIALDTGGSVSGVYMGERVLSL